MKLHHTNHKYYIVSFIFVLSGIVISCNKDFLEENIYDYRNPENLPAVSTDETGFKGGEITSSGTITKSGRSKIIDYGHCWSVNHNPTTADQTTSFGSVDKLSSFESVLSNLENRKTYYVRAFVTNEAATSYGNELKIVTRDSIVFLRYEIVEEDIVENGRFDFGENLYLRVYLVNRGNFEAKNVHAEFLSAGNNLIVEPGTKIPFGNIYRDAVYGISDTSSVKDQPYTIQVKMSPDAPEGQLSESVMIRMTDNEGRQSKDSILINFSRPYVQIKNPDEMTSWNMSTNQIILWDDNIDEKVKIELFRGASLVSVLADTTNSDGALNWNVTDTLTESDDYWIKITSVLNTLLFDQSPRFRIGSDEVKTIAIEKPNALSGWESGSTQTIEWFTNYEDQVKIELHKNGKYHDVIVPEAENSGSFTWQIPDNMTSDGTYSIKVNSLNRENIYDMSEEFLIFKSIEFITVEPDTFYMGNSRNIGGDESPLHPVIVSEFEMSKFEITNAQFAKFLNEYGSTVILEGENIGKELIDLNGNGINASEYEDGDECRIYEENGVYKVERPFENFPVIYVTWYGAKAFCEFYGGRLPTEAEWEYVAKGGVNKSTYKYSGSNELEDVAWYIGNSTANNTSRASHVGRKEPNVLGFYDMTGNASEWVFDWYDDEYYRISPVNNPQGPSNGVWRVVRGGCYNFTATYLYLENRIPYEPGSLDYCNGFRMAKGTPDIEYFIVVMEPKEDDAWKMNESRTIKWQDNTTGTIDIELVRNDNVVDKIAESMENTYRLEYKLPDVYDPGAGYTIRIISDENSIQTESKKFEILPADIIQVVTPQKNANWQTGQKYDITWTDNFNTYAVLELYSDGQYLQEIYQYGSSSSNKYSWEIPYDIPTGNLYQVKASNRNNQNVSDFSEFFTIEYVSPYNLRPAVPEDLNWNEQLIVTKARNYYSNDLQVTNQDELFVSFAYYLDIDKDLTSGFTSQIYMDDELIYQWDTTANLDKYDDGYFYQTGIPVGKISPGNHTFSLRLDPDNLIKESDESDNRYEIQVQVTKLTIEKGEIRDHEGNEYPTVKMNSQWWMANNIIASTSINGDKISGVCYSDNPENCNNYGSLYTQDDATGGLSMEFARGLCPEGWHVPAKAEWNELFSNYFDEKTTIDVLKNNQDIGFNLLFGGSGTLSGSYEGIDSEGYYRTSTYENSKPVAVHFTTNNIEFVTVTSANQDVMSLRCVKDNLPASLFDGLSAYYPFSGQAGDMSGNGNNGTLFDMYPATNRFDEPQKAYEFTDYGRIEIPDDASLRPGVFSVSVWCYLDKSSSYMPVIMKTSNSQWGDGYGIYVYNDEVNFFADGYNNHVSAPFTRKVWYHIVGIYTGEKIQLYVNNEFMGEKIQPQMEHSESALLIGKALSSYFWEGKIDDIRIYSRILTESDIDLLYNLNE